MEDPAAPLLGGKKPPGTLFKYFVLFIISIICFSPYFAFDSIQNLANEMEAQIGLSPTRFGILYSVYSIPNIVLPFFGGVMGDKLGLRTAALLLATLVVIGTAIVALAPMKFLGLSDTSIFIMMAAGRTVFGAGAESLNVTQIGMVTEWFRGGKQMAMAFALVLSVSRLGDFLALSSGAYIFRTWGGGNFDFTLIVACGMCIISLFFTVVYFFVDKFSERRYLRNKTEPEPFSMENFKCVLRFDLRFWLISILCMTYYSGVIPFIGMLTGWLQNKYGYNESDAGLLSSIVILASMILSPFLGKAVDMVGRRPLVVALGSLLILPAHFALTFTGPNFGYTVYPLWPIVAIGLSFSLVPAALWPCVPMIVPEENTTTAFGTMTAIQNGGLALVSFLVNYIRQHQGDKAAMLFFVAADALGLIGAIVLYLVDQKRGGTLCMIKSDKAQAPKSEIDDMPNYENPFADDINQTK